MDPYCVEKVWGFAAISDDLKLAASFPLAWATTLRLRQGLGFS